MSGREMEGTRTKLLSALCRQLGDTRVCPMCGHEFSPKDSTYQDGCKAYNDALHQEETAGGAMTEPVRLWVRTSPDGSRHETIEPLDYPNHDRLPGWAEQDPQHPGVTHLVVAKHRNTSWQPFETAPTEIGSRIIAYEKPYPIREDKNGEVVLSTIGVCIAKLIDWNGRSRWVVEHKKDIGGYPVPLTPEYCYWMPLPEAPQ